MTVKSDIAACKDDSEIVGGVERELDDEKNNAETSGINIASGRKYLHISRLLLGTCKTVSKLTSEPDLQQCRESTRLPASTNCQDSSASK